MRAQFEVRITPDDVGQRVTVRYRIDADEGRPQHSDVVGMLRRWADGTLTVENRHGDPVTVAEDRLVAGRVVGPPPTRRRSRS